VDGRSNKVKNTDKQERRSEVKSQLRDDIQDDIMNRGMDSIKEICEILEHECDSIADECSVDDRRAWWQNLANKFYRAPRTFIKIEKE